jgi:hypothetical protein
MFLATRRFATGDVRTVRINYTDWLMPGYALQGVMANIAPGAAPPTQSTVGAIVTDPVEMTAYININCAPVNETFTLNVVATDTFGQTINDTLSIEIVNPGAL